MNIASTIQQLYQAYGHLSGVTIECQKELLAIGIKNKAASAEVFLQGAQITRYQRIHERPVLFLSEQCTYQQGEPLRGGIPICWPWFGALSKNPKNIQQQLSEGCIHDAPAHGFIRCRDWQIDAIATPRDDLTVITLSISIDANEPGSWWPFAAKLTYHIEIGETLFSRFTVENIDQRRFGYSSALHSYFLVDDIAQTRIKGFDRVTFFDALQTDAGGQWLSRCQKGDITFVEAVDRVYQSGCHPVLIVDSAGEKSGRTIKLGSTGSNSSVVWNPWVTKSKVLSQFTDKDYLRMVCVETANALEDCIWLEPGESHSLSLAVA